MQENTKQQDNLKSLERKQIISKNELCKDHRDTFYLQTLVLSWEREQ